MAKYWIEHKCGHEQEHSLFGKSSSREWKMEQLRDEDCQECWRKSQQEIPPWTKAKFQILASPYKDGERWIESTNSYDIRDELKSRGWKWNQGRRAWLFDINDYSIAKEEIEWIREQGGKVSIPSNNEFALLGMEVS